MKIKQISEKTNRMNELFFLFFTHFVNLPDYVVFLCRWMFADDSLEFFNVITAVLRVQSTTAPSTVLIAYTCRINILFWNIYICLHHRFFVSFINKIISREHLWIKYQEQRDSRRWTLRTGVDQLRGPPTSANEILFISDPRQWELLFCGQTFIISLFLFLQKSESNMGISRFKKASGWAASDLFAHSFFVLVIVPHYSVSPILVYI